ASRSLFMICSVVKFFFGIIPPCFLIIFRALAWFYYRGSGQDRETEIIGAEAVHPNITGHQVMALSLFNLLHSNI
ncbi:MAG TPA: hypothetical protein DCL60_13555, partial [Armatimonadetes bacterium]|nr:hypothetical protein [Armatimonadota bacterium]